MSKLTDSLIVIIYIKIANFELSPPAKVAQFRIFNIDFDFEDEQSNRFTMVWLYKSSISKFRCYRLSLSPR